MTKEVESLFNISSTVHKGISNLKERASSELAVDEARWIAEPRVEHVPDAHRGTTHDDQKRAECWMARRKAAQPCDEACHPLSDTRPSMLRHPWSPLANS